MQPFRPLTLQAGSTDPNPAFQSEVRSARFFYLDQFVALASGGRLHLYRCVLLSVQARGSVLCSFLRLGGRDGSWCPVPLLGGGGLRANSRNHRPS